jgi:DNA-binding FrmR family transcriptional regulator
MLEEGSECEDALLQLAAVSKAISRGGYALVATGLEQCLAEGGRESVDAKKMEKLFLALA